MQFQWDEATKKANIEKYGLAFEDAHRVWKSDHQSCSDYRHDHDGLHFMTLGTLENDVVHCLWTQSEPNIIHLTEFRLATDYELYVYSLIF